MGIRLTRPGWLALVVFTTAMALTSLADAVVVPGDPFTFAIAGFNSTSGTGYILGSGHVATFGTTQTFTAAGVNGQDYTITSSEIVGATSTTDYFKITTPTNFLTTTTVSGTTITALQFDIGDGNSGVGVATGADPVNLVTPITSDSVTGSSVYGTANTVFTLTPTATLATGGLSFTAAEGVNAGTTAISTFAFHEFDFSITYANPAAATATTTTITDTSPLQNTYGQQYTIGVEVAAATGSVEPTTGTVTCTLQPQPSGTPTVVGPVSINAIDGTAQCAVPATEAPGTYSVTATYSGSTDLAFSGSTSSAATLTITPAMSSVTLSSPCSSTFVGGGNEQYTLNASVSPPSATGTVTFSVNGTAVCSNVALVGGSATCTVSDLNVQGSDLVDTLQFGAAYSGDTDTSPSSTTSNAQVVNASEAIFRNGFEEIVAGCPIE